jgi:flagella basal body P-ring formation protein FlgA
MPFRLLVLLLCGLPPMVWAQDGRAVQRAAEAALATRFPNEATRLAVRVVRTGGDLPPEAALQVAFPWLEALPRAHVQADVLTHTPATGWTKTGWAMLYISQFDSVAVLRTPRHKDEAIAPTDLDFAWIETTTFAGTPLRQQDVSMPGTPLVATRLLREGQVLRQTDVRAAWTVETGTAVQMSYRRGTLTLTLTCTAREPGTPGAIIRVYSRDTGTTYRARLLDATRAEWVETL